MIDAFMLNLQIDSQETLKYSPGRKFEDYKQEKDIEEKEEDSKSLKVWARKQARELGLYLRKRKL